DVGDVWVISAKSTPNPDPGPGPIPCGGRNYGPVSGPNPCRRPYSASSPWNTPVPGGTPAQSNSDQIVQRLMGFVDNPSNLDVSASGPSAEDYMTPIFTA